MSERVKVLVAGAGGFIGHHLVKHLKSIGYWVRGVDIKLPLYEESRADDFMVLDLRSAYSCHTAMDGIQHVYQLAADMGGIGYIYAKCAEPASNNIKINVHMLDAAYRAGVERYLYTSSACVYPVYKQEIANIQPLKESDVHPADPDHGYGWEKLFAEKLCQYYTHDYGMDIKIVRLHNVYGPLGSYDGGREKAPAALCRKAAMTSDGGEIELWGDGNQTRTFLYVEDCVYGLQRIMQCNYSNPLNLGTDHLVSINQLLSIIESIAGKKFRRRYNILAPQGVRGRSSDNTLLRSILHWEPSLALEYGLTETYRWIESQVKDHTPCQPALP